MSRTSLATPCPAPLTGSSIPISRRLSTASTTSSLQDDTCTLDLDYTRAIQQEFRNARPRRKSTFHRKADRNAGITIFEDVVEDEELVVDRAKMLGGSTLLGRPAQKMPRQAMKRAEDCGNTAQPLGEIGQSGRRTSIMPHAQTHDSGMDAAQGMPKATGGLKKDPRRRTIFVPADDTTMLTIHPGANTTDRLNDTFQLFSPLRQELPAEPVQPITTVEEQKPVRRARMSLAVAPKRMPLQHMAASANNLPGVDVPGENGGKENVPPGGLMLDNLDEKPVKAAKPAVVEVAAQKPAHARSKLFEPTAASQARQAVAVRKAVPLVNRTTKTFDTSRDKPWNPVAKPAKSNTAPHVNPQTHRSPAQPRSVSSSTHDKHNSERPTKTTTLPKRALDTSIRSNKLARYPLLPEDVAQPQLYEDNWLSHQEIALTELINEIFVCATPAQPAWQTSGTSLRGEMLDIYHQPSVTTLHKRLQASLLYGALSRPKDMPSPPDPTQDIGLRKKFLNIWLQTYDEEALRAAAEVVVGRQVPRKASSLPSGLQASESVLDPSKGKRTLIGFLETFLIVVEDLNDTNDDSGEMQSLEARRWRKMILRSLMLIWLLDQAKLRGATNSCLFKRSSALKSSVTVIHALSGLLIPSIGDITRALRHFDFAVTHVQDPLDEVAYRIENIAVDLRDGIFITRLVELLLFSSSPEKRQKDPNEADATMTITLPDATVLGSALFADDGSCFPRVLSQHLKMPCLGRAQKLHNVQVALSALEAYGGHAATAVQGVTADDVVDGHREKTLSLLWALVSTHGLPELVDWEELATDVRRNGASVADAEHATQRQQEDLLQAWISCYCRRKGFELQNLTTSFADARTYGALLDGFAFVLPSCDGQSDTRVPSLDTRLRSFGCSSAFVKQMISRSVTIPSPTTTTSNLAFLASRLLPLARNHHAASIIQRAFRHRRSWTLLTQRITLARLAKSCAEVVQTQQRLIDAATVLQRSWRRILDGRRAELSRKVEIFQVLARGWAVRRRMRQERAAPVHSLGNGQSLRAMSGW